MNRKVNAEKNTTLTNPCFLWLKLVFMSTVKNPHYYLDGFSGDCSSCLHHAVRYTQPVSVLHKRCHKCDIFGSSPRLEQAESPSLRVPSYVIQDQVKS